MFVAMPFGQKRDERLGQMVDFDAIYRNGIKPALSDLDVDIIRADEERSGGVIHVAMFERLLLAEVAIVDVTIDNANVFYELGVRHTARAYSTIIVASKDRILPFDIAMIRAVPYSLDSGVLTGPSATIFAEALRERVKEILSNLTPEKDSPLFQLIPNYAGVSLSLTSAESFRSRMLQFNEVREELLQARQTSSQRAVDAIAAIERRELAAINEANFELVVDVLLSYRDVKAFDRLLALVDRLPKEFYDRSGRIRQLQAFALNKRNHGDDRLKAVGILQDIVSKSGEEPETCGLLGSINKLRFDDALAAGESFKAKSFLVESIKWYRRGFLADTRDYYPGVNLCVLLAVEGSDRSYDELKEVLPSVRLAVKRAGGPDSTDFWVVATALVLAVLANDWDTASAAHGRIITLAEGGPHERPQPWMLETTKNDLLKLREANINFVDNDSLDALIRSIDETLGELDTRKATT